jgi:8-oxo-dGTP pyrophosphatase MutT (NUDIX family)
MIDWNALTEAEIMRRLAAAYQPGTEPESPGIPPDLLFNPGPSRPAAVLIPMLRQNGGWHLLYTRRNSDLPEHSGQVAFPGGRSDPDDANPEDTALREAQEEIGLSPRDVRLLGRMHDFLTVTNYLVTPVIGVIPWPYPLILADHEVSRAFTISLDWLADPANQEIYERLLPEPHTPVPVIYYHEYDGEVLWGASARFTVRLIEVLSENQN